MLAVQEGRDDLAKQALVRQRRARSSTPQQLEVTWQAHQAETEKLKASLRDLNDKIEEAKRKKNLLLARQRRAQAQKRIAETMSSISEKSAFEAFARMEESIEQNERQIKASRRDRRGVLGRPARERTSSSWRRAHGSTSADMQLLALKQKMGMLGAGQSAASKQLGAGGTRANNSANDEEVHAEIEDDESPDGKKAP